MDENYTQHQTIEKGLRINVSGNLIIISRCNSYSGICSSPGLGERGAINSFSESSRARLRKYLRETRANYQSMVTLTYPANGGVNGVASKEHLRRFLQELRRGTKRDREHWSCFWFLEFQSRGAIHFHILCTHFYHYEWIARKWYAIVGSGCPDHLHAGTRIEKIRSGRNGIASYCAKYAAKFDQKLVPENFGWVGRFWGVSGYRDRVSAATHCPEGFEAEKVVSGALKTIKKLISSRKMAEISSKMPNLPSGILIYRCASHADTMRVIRCVKLIELFLAIKLKREPNFEDEIEELYEEMTTSDDWELEKGDYQCQGSVTTSQTEQGSANILKRMLGESFVEWSARVGTGKNFRKKSSNALSYVITSELERQSLSYWKRRRLYQSL